MVFDNILEFIYNIYDNIKHKMKQLIIYLYLQFIDLVSPIIGKINNVMELNIIFNFPLKIFTMLFSFFFFTLVWEKAKITRHLVNALNVFLCLVIFNNIWAVL